MTPREPPPDPRRIAEFEIQLTHAVERLEPRLQHLERVCALLVDIAASARALTQAQGIGQGLRQIWPHLSDVVYRAQHLARQITATIDDLQAVVGEPLSR